MSANPNPGVTIDEDDLYYFLNLHEGNYYTAFVSWLRQDMVQDLTDYFSKNDPQKICCIKLTVGENRFVVESNQPFYLFNYKNKAAFEFAGDDGELELFPSGNVPANLDMDPLIDFPSFWHKGVESMLEFKIEDRLFQNRNGVWTPLELNNK